MIFFFSSGRRHTRFDCDWSSDVCSSDLEATELREAIAGHHNVKPEQVFVGNGSDEVLAHAFAALLKQPKPLLFPRSEEHTSELQSQSNLVCRLLLEKKKKNVTQHNDHAP